MGIRMSQTSWPRLQRHLQMSSFEAKVAQVIVSAAVVEFRSTRGLEACVPLVSVIDNPEDVEAIATLPKVLSKAWHLSNGRQSYGFAIVEDWAIDQDRQVLSFRVSPMVVELFDGIDMSQSLH